MKFLLSLAVFAASWTVLAQGTSEAILSYNDNGVSSYFNNGTVGWTFQPTTPLVVNSLGCFADVFVNNPLVSVIEVGLWGPSGSLLASNSVTSSSTLFDQTRYVSVTPVSLTSGQVYHIGVFYIGGGLGLDVAAPTTGGSVSASSSILLDGAAYTTNSFTSPAQQTGTAGAIYAGPNFQFMGGVPEPSSWLLAGLGGWLLAARLRRQRR
jgi:hypothetical protein